MGVAFQLASEEYQIHYWNKNKQLNMEIGGKQRSSRIVVATFWQIWGLMLFICFISAAALGANNISNPSSFLVNNRRALAAKAVSNTFNVDNYGAKGDGVTDNKKAFLAAWNAACSGTAWARVLIVPANKIYLVSPITFTGPCNGRLYFQIDGTVIAPSKISAFEGLGKIFWILFKNLESFVLRGNGIIDGNGHKWWACKNAGQCASAPNGLTFYNANSVKLSRLRVMNSQQFQLVFLRSSNILVSGLKVQAPETSPNTDGIHISQSNNISLHDCVVGTGDDCVAMNQMSSNITILNLMCGPGHGISIGSLGKDNSEDQVTDVFVDGAKLHNTTNGVRIKTWQGGRGLASSVVFQNIKMTNVRNPIIIDQYYCDKRATAICQNQTMAVHISNVHYRNIRGTSSTQDAISLKCSNSRSCSNLVFENVNLAYVSNESNSFRNQGAKSATSVCSNANVSITGLVVPFLHC